MLPCQQVCRTYKLLRGDAARTADPIWSEAYSIPCGVMLKNKTGGAGRWLPVFGDQLGVGQLVVSNCTGRHYFFFFPSPFLLNCLHLKWWVLVLNFFYPLPYFTGRSERMAAWCLTDCWVKPQVRISQFPLTVQADSDPIVQFYN